MPVVRSDQDELAVEEPRDGAEAGEAAVHEQLRPDLAPHVGLDTHLGHRPELVVEQDVDEDTHKRSYAAPVRPDPMEVPSH